MTRMTDAEKQQFLSELHVGVLSISRKAQGPLTVPVWYDYAPGGDLWFLTGRNSRKGRLLKEGKRISLCAQNESLPYKYVSVEGPVTSISEPGDTGLPMAVRYLGEAQGRAYHESGSEDDSVLVRMRCEHWLAVDYSKSGR